MMTKFRKPAVLGVILAAAMVTPTLLLARAQSATDILSEMATNGGEMDVTLPGDELMTCPEIKVELAGLDRSIASVAVDINVHAVKEADAQARDRKTLETAQTAQDALNRASPVGVALGNPVYQAAEAVVKARKAARDAKTLAMGGNAIAEMQFAAGRIPYLHALAAGKCTAPAP